MTEIEKKMTDEAYRRFPDIVEPDDCHPLGKIVQDNGSLRYAFLEGGKWGAAHSSERIGKAMVWTVESDCVIVSVWLTKGAADKIAEHHRERAPMEKWRVASYHLVSGSTEGANG